MPELRAKVIVNPEAGSGSVIREWPKINRQLRQTGLPFEYEFTREPGHAITIAQQAIDHGFNYLIAAGGDGTVNEVANGILRSGNASGILLGIISTGTAHAFSFSLGITDNYDNINDYSFLAGQRRALIDVGLVQCSNQGKLIDHFFLNHASVGFSADVVDSWKSLPNRFGKVINLALRTITGYKSLAFHRNKNINIKFKDEDKRSSICTLIVANGQYYADKMLIAPHAHLDDGLLDIIIVEDVSKLELLKIVPTLYKGNHIYHPKVKEKKVDVIKIESNEHLLVEADGDILGECPASFWIKPAALNIAVPDLP
jgi:diacylglycerol kinase (ATP)